MRLIDVDAFLEYETKRCDGDMPYIGTCMTTNFTLVSELSKMPTIDAVPVVHGHWKYGESFMLGENRKCSVCGGMFPCTSAWVMSYCPDCGAKMDEVSE